MAHAVDLTPSEAEARLLPRFRRSHCCRTHLDRSPPLRHLIWRPSTTVAVLGSSNLALHLSRSSQRAEDLCHDVFLRFWHQGRHEPMRDPVLAYLLLLTRPMAISRINRRKNRWPLLQRWSDQCCLRP